MIQSHPKQEHFHLLSINSDHGLCSSIKFYSFIQISVMLAKFIHRYFIVFMTIVNGPPPPPTFISNCIFYYWMIFDFVASIIHTTLGSPPLIIAIENVENACSCILTKSRASQTMHSSWNILGSRYTNCWVTCV